jgi:hypothetical protein
MHSHTIGCPRRPPLTVSQVLVGQLRDLLLLLRRQLAPAVAHQVLQQRIGGHLGATSWVALRGRVSMDVPPTPGGGLSVREGCAARSLWASAEEEEGGGEGAAWEDQVRGSRMQSRSLWAQGGCLGELSPRTHVVARVRPGTAIGARISKQQWRQR